MRLTLRTLLAYMDDILEPKDAQAIGKKIEESEFATGLLHRTREVMRRLRLAAPELSDTGAGLDANTVAEYLDNTLAGDRVPDFEKVCLESDIQLAEVASCHQILTLVLGEPAEVDPAGRERMYKLAGQAEAQTSSSGEAGQPTHAPRQKPTVPDYLRAPSKKRRFLPTIAALVLVGFFVVVILAALGQFEPGRPVARLLGISSTESSRPLARRSEVTDEAVETPSSEEEFGTADQPGEPASDSGVAEPGPSEQVQPPRGDSPSPATEAKPADRPGPQVPPAETAPPSVPPAEKPAPSVATSIPRETTPGTIAEKPVRPPELTPGPEPDESPPKATLPPDAEPPHEPSVKPDTAPKAKPAPVPQEPVGRLMSSSAVLLMFDADSASWTRVPAKGMLAPRHRLLVLPTYRPEIALATGITLQLLGGARMELLPTVDQQLPGVRVDYGRLVIMPLAEAGTRLQLEVGDRSGVITLGDVESRVAIEATRTPVPGVDPEKQPADLTIDLHAVSGRIAWQKSGDAQPVTMESPARLRLGEQPSRPVAAVQNVPEWIDSDTVGLLDRRASGTLEESLQVDRPVSLVLRELGDHRQREVRWLAARCLGHIGEFGPMVAVLNDPEQKAIWPDYIEHLKGALTRDPQVATQVRHAFEKEYGPEAADLLRLLWGFTEEGLRNGEAAMLVEYLDHETLAFRVLSYWNLKEITGMGLYYQPEFSEAKRRQSVQKWKERLASGEIWAKMSEGKPVGGDQKPESATPPKGGK